MTLTTITRLAAVLVTVACGVAQDTGGTERPVQIELRGATSLPGVDVRLGDVATVRSIEPELARRVRDIRIADRPALGFSRTFDRADVHAALASAGVPRDAVALTGAERTVAQPATRVLEAEALRRVADAILEKTLLADPDVVTRFEPLRPIRQERVPAGRTSVQLRGRAVPDRSAITRATVAVDVVVDGAVWRTIDVDYRLQRFVTATTVVRAIPRGARLSRADLTPVEVELGSRRGHHFARAEDLVGLVAARDLAVGRPLLVDDATAPTVVQKNDPVRLISRRGRIQIAVRAVALEDGAIGDHVQVKNLAGGQPVQAVVHGPGLVIVPGSDGDVR